MKYLSMGPKVGGVLDVDLKLMNKKIGDTSNQSRVMTDDDVAVDGSSGAITWVIESESVKPMWNQSEINEASKKQSIL